MSIGERLKTLRKHEGWAQMELARRSGVPQQLISRYEKNITAIGVDNLTRLAATLKCAPQDIDERFSNSGTVVSESKVVRRIDDEMLLGIVDCWNDGLPIDIKMEIISLVNTYKKTHRHRR